MLLIISNHSWLVTVNNTFSKSWSILTKAPQECVHFILYTTECLSHHPKNEISRQYWSSRFVVQGQEYKGLLLQYQHVCVLGTKRGKGYLSLKEITDYRPVVIFGILCRSACSDWQRTSALPFLLVKLDQGCKTPLLEDHCPSDFSSIPNQTHLKNPTKVFRIAWRLQAGVFDKGWKLNSAEQV